MAVDPMKSNLTNYGEGSLEEWLVWKDKLVKALDGQSMSTESLRYKFTGNKVLLEITKHEFSVYTFCKQKRYLRRHLVQPWSMKLRSFIIRLHDLNAYLAEFPSDTEGQGIVPLSTCKKNHGHHLPFYAYHVKKQDDLKRFQLRRFYCERMTDFFKIRVENLTPKEEKKNLLHVVTKK